jgi:hypothetical protein
MEDPTTFPAPRLKVGDVLPPSALFTGARHELAFGGVRGLCPGPDFTPDEVARIRALIKAHMVSTARTVSPDAAPALEAADLEDFHKVTGYDHRRMLSKQGRILSREAIDEIRSMSFFAYAQEAFGPFALADEEGVGYEQITFRLVRPHRAEDVGSLHRDAWFWDYYGTPLSPGAHRAKMWMGICTAPGMNGLRLAPGSHLSEAPYQVNESGPKVAFDPLFDWKEIGLAEFESRAGRPLLFNYRTLHVGSLNRADVCRVSIETTFLYH